MTRREEQAHTNGKIAAQRGFSRDACTIRRDLAARAAWLRGYDEQHRHMTAEQATDAQQREAHSVITRLKAYMQAQGLVHHNS